MKPNVKVVIRRVNGEVEENETMDLTGCNTNQDIIGEVLSRVNQCNCYHMEQDGIKALMTVLSIHKDGEIIYIIDYNL
jgi:hypothetical protein